MAKKATGEKAWRVRLNTWVGRVRDESGKRCEWLSLDTTSKDIADEKLAKWIATGEAPSQAGREPFEKAAERLVDGWAASNPVLAGDRRTRLRQFAYPQIGPVAVSELKMPMLFGVLERMAKEDYSESAIHHMRTDFSRICKRLVLEGAITENPAQGMQLPEEMAVDDRPWAVPTDEETSAFFRAGGFDSEIMMLSAVSRYLGGQRTSDLHAFDYAGIDWVNWRARVRRPKTEGRTKKRRGQKRATRAFEWVLHEIPVFVRGPLEAWWHAQGKPARGPVFPLRRGPKAGQRKTGRGICYTEPLRDAFWAAGVHRPLPGYESAVGDERRKFCALQVGVSREMSERTGLPEMRPLEFHSWRRAYVTALHKAGMGMLDAMAAAGHTDPATHAGYNAPELVSVPAAALPGEAAAAAAAAQPRALPPAPSPCPGPDAPGMPSSQASADKRPATPSTTLLQGDPVEHLADLPSGLGAGQGPSEAPAPSQIDELLAGLRALLLSANDPRRGAIGPGIVPAVPQNPEAFQGRARLGSNQGPTAPEAIEVAPSAQIASLAALAERASALGHEHVLTRDAGQSSGAAPTHRETPTPSPAELLRAAAHAAVDVGNWRLIAAIGALIDEEARAAAAASPVRLEAVRARKEGGSS